MTIELIKARNELKIYDMVRAKKKWVQNTAKTYSYYLCKARKAFAKEG